jgi:CDP-6-deoxy-D-xylo-4-hexulose-3-dehydrase
LFAGNLTKQPYLKNKNYKTFGTLENTDLVMNNGFWIGVFPGLTQEMLQYVVEEFKNFINLFE